MLADRQGFWGVVLAGAHPKGRSIFDRLAPRPLLPVIDTPVVGYALRWLAQGGVEDATICANSAARGVRGLLDGLTRPGMKVAFFEDWMPRGAAGCVRDAAVPTTAHTFVVVDGTTIPKVDMAALVDTHRRQGAALTVAVHPETRGASAPFLSPNGAYVFDRRALEHIADQGFQDIKESLIPRLHAAGEQIAFLECAGRSPRIFDAESYLSVNRWAISRLSHSDVAADLATKGYHAHEEGFVHESSRVSPRSRLVGPVVVGPGASVEADATLVGPVAIGGASLVAEGAVVSRSVVWGHCRLGRESLVDGCLVSDRAHVPRGASRYRVLETGQPRGGPESPLRVSAWALSRVKEWVDLVGAGRPACPSPQPVAGHLRGEMARRDRLVALDRSRG